MALADCPHCGGTGWKIIERDTARSQVRTRPWTQADAARMSDVDILNLEEGSPLPAEKSQGAGPGISSVAVRCECVASDRTARLLARARIPGRHEHCDFENFDTGLYENEPDATAWNRSLEQAKLVVESFARDYPVGTDAGLLLMGPCGVGKTHLAVAVLKQLVLRGHDVLFYDYRELLKEIQASYNPVSQTTEMGVLEPVLTVELLLLDDLGASKPSAWALETVGHILNTRYNDKRITLLTTNYLDSPAETSEVVELPPGQRRQQVFRPPGNMGVPKATRLPSGQAIRAHSEETLADRISQRIRSRLYEMCRTVEMIAPDYRKEIRQAGGVRS